MTARTEVWSCDASSFVFCKDSVEPVRQDRA